MQMFRTIIIIGTILIGVVIIFRLTPRKSVLRINQEKKYFPTVTGYNLNRQELEFPRDFAGEFNLVFIPFQRHHQDIVDSWIPTAQKIEAGFEGFIYYELPTLASMSTLYRTFLNEGMRAGIPNQTSRLRTITLYLDKESFRSALDIPSENDIYVFLVDQQGEILWRTVGGFNQEKADDLLLILNQSGINSKEKSE